MKKFPLFALPMVVALSGCAAGRSEAPSAAKSPAEQSVGGESTSEIVQAPADAPRVRLEVLCEPCKSDQIQKIKGGVASGLARRGWAARIDSVSQPGEPALRVFGLLDQETWYLTWVVLSPSGRQVELSRSEYADFKVLQTTGLEEVAEAFTRQAPPRK